jgi:hypothetical protein
MNPRLPLEKAPEVRPWKPGGLYKVGPKCFTDREQAGRWAAVLERPVEVWRGGKFVKEGDK